MARKTAPMPPFMARLVSTKWADTYLVVPIDSDLEIGGGPMPGYGDRPVDPGYSPPWAQVPGGGNGGPVDPGYSPPWAQVPGAGPGTLAYVYPPPAGATPPADPVPAGWTVQVVSKKGEDGPAWAYVGPHLQHNKPA